MSKITKPANHLLAALPAKEYHRLPLKLEEIPLTYNEIVYESGDVIRHVYFPGGGIISLLSATEDHSLLEIGIVGNEGFIGLPVFLGVKTSNNRALVQGAGASLRMKTADFLTESKKGGVPAVTAATIHALALIQISRTTVGNRFHPVEARLSRWLLMTADRMKSDKFQITQEFLSNMLGVRREAVNKSATNLQQNKLISHSRGNVSILARAGLESATCHCYFIIKDESQKMFEEPDYI